MEMWRLHIKQTLLLLALLLVVSQLIRKWTQDAVWPEQGPPHSAGDKHYGRFVPLSAVSAPLRTITQKYPDHSGAQPPGMDLSAQMLRANGQVRMISRACNTEVVRPDVIPNLQAWQKVGDSSTYVFSAYYDSRSHLSVVRIITITINHTSSNRFCRVWFRHRRQAKIVPAEVGPIPETHGRKYAAVFLLCYLPGRTPDIPFAVSVVRHQCETATNLLRVHYTPTPSMPLFNFTVCVTPLNRYYDNVNQMTEMIEVNRMFGAQKVLFYNNSSGQRVQPLMESYMKDGLLQVVPWDLPVKTETSPPTPGVEIHYFAQLAALNDCFYRNIHKSRYIVFSDLDELIVPRSHDTWEQLLAELQESHALRKTSSFLFRCTFFKTEWPDDDVMAHNHKAQVIRPLTLLKTKRERRIWLAGMRSKYIIVPGRVDTVGVHMVLKYRTGRRTEDDLAVPEKLGLLHHYRFWNDPQDTKWLVDKSMHRFARKIMQSVNDRLERVKLLDFV